MRILSVVLAVGLLTAAFGGASLRAEQRPPAPPPAEPFSLRAAARQPWTPALSGTTQLDVRRTTTKPHSQSSHGQIRGKSNGAWKTWVGATVGAVGGFFLGGYLGAKIDGDCACDSPGLKGFLIGAPIGAIVGGAVGAAVGSR